MERLLFKPIPPTSVFYEMQYLVTLNYKKEVNLLKTTIQAIKKGVAKSGSPTQVG